MTAAAVNLTRREQALAMSGLTEDWSQKVTRQSAALVQSNSGVTFTGLDGPAWCLGVLFYQSSSPSTLSIGPRVECTGYR
jgi:hypothetical protein